MPRKALSIATIAVVLIVLPLGMVSRAQIDSGFGGTSNSAFGGPGGAIEGWAITAFWVLILADAVLLILAAVAYITAYTRPEMIEKGNRRILYAVATLIVAILVRVFPTLF